MRYKFITYTALILGLSIETHAAPPAVAVDIAPVHSLVSLVMEGVGKPKLIIPAEASPHRYTLRPSEAKTLADAELVFWMGESYTPWLEKALHNVASSAQKIEVLEIEGTTTYAFREGATFESHDHDEHEGEDHNDEHYADKKEHHDDEKTAHHDEQEKESHEDHHDHEGNDPHAWLDPENAKVWIKHISATLSKQDPDNASTYGSNAAKAISSLDELIQSTHSQINTLGHPQFIVFHDAYQYFEKRFGISAAGSISLGDAEDPSPARIKEIRDTIQKLGVTCIFTEPQYNSGLVSNVFDGTSISTIGVMDPLGASLTEGNDHYKNLIKGMVASLSQCQ